MDVQPWGRHGTYACMNDGWLGGRLGRRSRRTIAARDGGMRCDQGRASRAGFQLSRRAGMSSTSTRRRPRARAAPTTAGPMMGLCCIRTDGRRSQAPRGRAKHGGVEPRTVGSGGACLFTSTRSLGMTTAGAVRGGGRRVAGVLAVSLPLAGRQAVRSCCWAGRDRAWQALTGAGGGAAGGGGCKYEVRDPGGGARHAGGSMDACTSARAHVGGGGARGWARRGRVSGNKGQKQRAAAAEGERAVGSAGCDVDLGCCCRALPRLVYGDLLCTVAWCFGLWVAWGCVCVRRGVLCVRRRGVSVRRRGVLVNEGGVLFSVYGGVLFCAYGGGVLGVYGGVLSCVYGGGGVLV